MNETKLVLRIDVLASKNPTVYAQSATDDKSLFAKMEKTGNLTVLGSIYFADDIVSPAVQLSPSSQFLALLPLRSKLPIQPWYNDNSDLGVMLSCSVTHLMYWAEGIVTKPDSPRYLERAGVEQHLVNKFKEAVK